MFNNYAIIDNSEFSPIGHCAHLRRYGKGYHVDYPPMGDFRYFLFKVVKKIGLIKVSKYVKGHRIGCDGQVHEVQEPLWQLR